MEKLPKVDMHRTITWIDYIDQENFNRVMNKMIVLLKKNETMPIHLIINSMGGTTRRAHAFYDFVRVNSIPLYTYGIGFVDSAAIEVFLSGEKRFISPNTTMLLHESVQEFDKNDSVSYRRIKSTKAELQKEYRDSIRIILSRIGPELSRQKLMAMHHQERNLSSEEIIRFGFAHEIWKPEIQVISPLLKHS